MRIQEGVNAMHISLSRRIALGGTLLVFLLETGCAVIPQKEFNAYRAAFAEVNSATEQLLVEYGAAQRVEVKHKAGNTPVATQSAPYPPTVNLSLSTSNTLNADPVDVRRQGLEVVANFNDVLVVLAEGKSIQEVRSNVDTLIGGLNNLSELLGVAKAIPYAGQIVSLVSTVVVKLEEANNRRQFIAAVREGEPIIRDILSLFAQDAETIYKIRAAQADRNWTEHQDVVATLVRQMRKVSKDHTTPTGNRAKKLADIEKKVRAVLDRAGLQNNSEKLPTDGNSRFGELTLSQLEQTLAQAEDAARKYEAVLEEQNALYKLVVSYGGLLAQTNSSLIAVRAALDSPPDIRAQANNLVAFVFAVKRNWEALNDARRAAAGS
ncbi:MAG: hypothetical protein O6949_01170 [Chloroflexi bacterium]|nr:hypothetical protein [Chloroflexota bacterium]